MKKIILIAIFTFSLISLFNCSFAVDTAGIMDYFKNPSSDLPSTTDMRQTLLSVLTYVGYALAVVVLLITAVQFIIGNPAQRAKLKEKLWLILFGVVILAAGLPILQLIADIMEDFGQSL